VIAANPYSGERFSSLIQAAEGMLELGKLEPSTSPTSVVGTT
jgi:hypothetical protein